MADRPLLVPDVSCGSLHEDPPSGLLVDGRDFYKAVYDACSQATRSILIAGWQFDNRVALLRGEDAAGAEHPTHFIGLLRDLCERRPELEVYLLEWAPSLVFAFERMPFQGFLLRFQGHPRIHYRTDSSQPFGASQHQKLVVVDRAIALLGGMDICNSRWDRRAHRSSDPDRRNRFRHYRPYHDVHAYVADDPVDVLRDWFCERWKRATGTPLELPSMPRTEVTIEPTLEIHAPTVGLARTLPALDDSARDINELYELHVRAIAAAEQLIYLESQYLSSNLIGRAIEQRLARDGDPLQIVVMLPAATKTFKERISMGERQARVLKRLGDLADKLGHRLGVYYSAAEHEVPVFVHAKVLAVDDRFLLVSSANGANRSMGFDSELGIAWEAPSPETSIQSARIELLAEHCGIPRPHADELLGPITGLVTRLDELARARSCRLRLHSRDHAERPGWLVSKLVREPSPFDPRDARTFYDALPRAIAWLVLWLRSLLHWLRR